MAKRKITVTVDEGLVEAIQTLGAGSMSGVVNAALASEVDRRARAAALARLLDGWDRELGPVAADVAADAAASFDDLDALAETAAPGPQWGGA
ncbi:MAG: CopG family transcriptional regulator [Acidimicrobiales bacterium]